MTKRNPEKCVEITERVFNMHDSIQSALRVALMALIECRTTDPADVVDRGFARRRMNNINDTVQDAIDEIHRLTQPKE